MKIFFGRNSLSISKLITVFIFLTIIVFSFINLSCNRQGTDSDSKSEIKKNAEIPHFSVVRSRGKVKILHVDKTEEKGDVGSFLFEGDRIISEDSGMADLQLSDDTILRIFPSSELLIASMKNEKEPAKVSLVEGKILGKIFSGTPNSSISVSLSSLVMSAEGSEFSAEEKNGNSKIKVKFGKAVCYFRTPELGDREPSEIKESDPLYKLAKTIIEKTINIDSMKEYGFSKNPEPSKLYSNSVKNSDLLQKINTVSLQPYSTIIPTSEMEEFNSLSPVDKSLLASLFSVSRDLLKGDKDSAKLEELEAKRSSLENQLLKFNYANSAGFPGKDGQSYNRNKNGVYGSDFRKNRISRSISRRLSYYKKKGRYKKYANRTFLTKQELYKYYERLEKLVLADNTYEIGTIISQDEDIIILHTEEGIKRIPSNQVKEVTYDFFKKKYR